MPILRVALPCFLAAAPAGAADLKPWTGGPASGLELRALDGRAHRLADYRGNVVLVNFWATWCVPCREEMPSMQRLREKLAGRPFVVLAVNLDEPEARIRKFLSQMRVEFTILLDPGNMAARAWDARILPASYVIGPDGRIRYSVVGELDWGTDQVIGRIAELLPPGL
ncbi:MAG: TlpA family protein disulfide reductase [Thermodesulfobacteriota bacterium]